MSPFLTDTKQKSKQVRTQTTGKERLLSLDFLRGFTVASMLLVNDPGDWSHIYPPLEHSKWNGCTPTDLVFPFFLFMVGVSIVYALQSKKTDVTKHNALLLSVLRRTLIIFSLGVFMPLITHFDFEHLRIPGVLQRIAIVYGITAVLYLKTSTRTQILIAAACLIGYYLIMTLIPVPGVGYANLEPTTNLGAWIDRTLFTTNHLWSQSKTWDPEGLLGIIPAVGTGLIGLLTGTYLKQDKLKNGREILQMAGTGILLIIAGLIWNIFFPINKALWTSSFVLFTAGLAITILSGCYWLIDIKGCRKLTYPFLAFGRNAITTYILAGFVPGILSAISVTSDGKKTNLWSYIYNHLFVPYLSPVNASLAGGILMVIIIFLPIWFLYVKKITIRI
jgi:predicted acyltransferase